VPIKVFELEQGKERNSVRGKILEFLKKNPDLAYTLKEIYTFCINEDKSDNNYKTNPMPIRSPFLDETDISEEQIVGNAIFRIPFLGYVKIWYTRSCNP